MSRAWAVVLACVAVLILSACGGPRPRPPTSPSPPAATVLPSDGADAGDLVIASGWPAAVVAPVVHEFEVATGLQVAVREGSSWDLAGTLGPGEAGVATDLFLSAGAGPLGAAAEDGRLVTLPSTTLARVGADVRDAGGRWVGVDGVARAVAYDRQVLDAAELPNAIDGFTDARWDGRIGWAPTDPSFQAMVTADRILDGYDATTEWINGIVRNHPRSYADDDAILAAIGSGEIAVGFVDHEAVARRQATTGGADPVQLHLLSNRDLGSLVNVDGAGVVTGAAHPDAALRFIEWLLSPASQQAIAESTWAYPLVAGVPASPGLVPLERIARPDLDLSLLRGVSTSVDLLRAAGAL